VTGTTHGAIIAHDALALGASAEDRFQGANRHLYLDDNKVLYGNTNIGSSIAGVPNGNGVANAGAFTIRGFVDDGTNGTPRVGTTTRGKIIGLNFIIKT
jgi:hypothetical protein